MLLEKRVDAVRYLFSVRFQCKMPSVQQMCLDVWQIPAVRKSAFRRKDQIVLAPYDQGRRLILPEERLELLAVFWQHEVESREMPAEYTFLASVVLQPFAEYLAERTNSSTESSPPLCPFCGSKPQLAVLRPEGDGGKRFLVCSLCATEWVFRRVLCPNCAEENKDKLPIFIAKEFDYVRIDACDTCRTYIKSIDLTKNGNAIPVVDELATVSLNLWAQENNYQKLQANLFGV